jgi:hypothetical protein
MAQRNIDFGTFPDDPSADAIRTAFQKVQENFTEVYAGVEGASVASVNRTPGAGITVSAPTGNVIVTANIACVQVHTSTLSIGRDSNGAQDTSITSSSQTLWLDLPANISNVSNINLSGYATAVGNVTGGNLITGGQVVATGNVSGSNITTAGQVVASGNITGGNLITTGTFSVTGNANVGNLGTSGLIVATGNVTGGNLVTGGALSVTGNANVGNIGAVSGVLTGTFSVTGNANVGNLGTARILATANVTAPQLISNVAVGTAPLVVTSTTVVPNLYVSRANVADFVNANLVSTGTFYPLLANATSGNVEESANANLSFNAANGALIATTFVGALSGAATSATTAGTVTTNAQPNITSTGTLTSLGVNGTITAVAITANTGIFTGNGSGLTQLTGANVTGTVANATYAVSAGTSGTVTTSSQPNITSVGTLTGLTAGGIIDTSSASNVTLGNLANLHITGGSSGYTIKTDGAGNLSWGVDTAAAGGTNTYVQFNDGDVLNGSANYTFDKVTNQLTLAGNIQTNNANLGNSVTANYFTGNFYGRANTANTVLIAAQPNITSVGTLTGLTVSGVTSLGPVSNVSITGGTNLSVLTTDGTGTLTWGAVVTTPPGGSNTSIQYKDGSTYQGSANLTFNDATNLMTVTGNIQTNNANLGNLTTSNYFAGTLTTAAQPNITSVGTLAGLTVSSAGLIVSGAGNVNAGNITATGVFAGNGANLTTLTGSNVTGTVANATYATSAGTSTSATTAGTVTTNAQPNITSVGTLTSLGVTANIASGNLNASGQVNASGNVIGSYFYGNGTTLTGVASHGHPLILNGTSNVSIPSSNANVTMSVNGTSNVMVVTSNGANITGTLNASGNANVANIGANNGVFTAITGTLTTNAQPNITSTGTLTSLAVTGNISAGNVSATTFTGSLSGAATSATTAGTVTTAAQPNITSTGTLTSMTSTGNVQGANVIATAYHIRSVGTGITAAGTTQGAGTVLSKEINIVSTVASGANAVVLPTAVAGMVVNVTNTTANAMLVFPASGAQINSLGTNLSFSQSTTTIQFIAPSSTQWYTVGATYA